MSEYERLSLKLLANILACVSHSLNTAQHSADPATRNAAAELALSMMGHANEAIAETMSAIGRDDNLPPRANA